MATRRVSSNASRCDKQKTALVVTERQQNQIREFFGPSIDYGKVVIKQSPFILANRPWTCGNVIRVRQGPRNQTIAVDTADLIHEFGHVWQHQAGKMVLLSALFHQLISSVIHKFDPYDYGGASGIKDRIGLSDLSTESQAEIIAECWKAKNGYATDRLHTPFSEEYISDLVRLVNGAQIGSAIPKRFNLPSFIDSAAALVVNSILGVFEE